MDKKQIVVGIDIGGTNTVFGFVDREGHILAEDKIKTTHYSEPEVFVAALYEKIMITLPKIGYDVEILGFGIGAPMGNINKGTIEYPADLPWKGIIPLAKDLIFEPTKESMEQNLLTIYKGKVKLLQSELSTQNAAVLGASSLIWSEKEY